MDIQIEHFFKGKFLSSFVLAKELLPFSDNEILEFDENLSKFEQIILNPDIQRKLISKNELLASFAISKAENSNLTLSEAAAVHKLVEENKNLTNLKNPTKKDYEKLEFFNISKTFKKLNASDFKIKDLNSKFISDLHLNLTKDMDLYSKYLTDFTLYKSGKWRDNNEIRMGEYVPCDYKLIEDSVEELVAWIKKYPTVINIAIFHTALYAIHPFNNGNKRVCRILEHSLLRTVGLNSKNLYSTSYYYHKEKERYYKYLLYALERKNLNHFVSFVQEALILSIISVVKTSIESKRLDFVSSRSLNRQIKTIVKPLIKRKEVQFKNLYKVVKRKFARQTFVNYLDQALDMGIITKRTSGRAVYYKINLDNKDEETLKRWLSEVTQKLSYIPDDIRLT